MCLCVKARAYNCQIRPAMLDNSSRVKWTNTAHQPAYLVGEEVSAPVFTLITHYKYSLHLRCQASSPRDYFDLFLSHRLFMWVRPTVTTSTGRL